MSAPRVVAASRSRAVLMTSISPVAAMFIAIVGTPSSGKRTVLDYLIDNHGFSQVGLDHSKDPMEAAKIVSRKHPPS